jgi:hypothetical protein
MWEACVFIGAFGLLLAFLQRKSLKEGLEAEIKPVGKYIKLDKNSICYEGRQINSQEECQEAINELKLSNTLPWIGNDNMLPSGCSWKDGKMHWNSVKGTGLPRVDLAPVCYKQSQSGAGFVMLKDEPNPIEECKKINHDIHLKIHEGEKAKEEIKEIKAAAAKKPTPLEEPAEWKAGISKINELDFLRNNGLKGSYVPRGAVAIWSGKTPPKGWALCDGRNGTPDLRNRFVMGSGTEKIGTKGGSSRISIEQMPKHNHESLGGEGEFELGTIDAMKQDAGQWIPQTVRSWTADKAYRKTKEVGKNAEYHPPYYRLAFIMKV